MSANSYPLSSLPLETPIPRKENRQCSLQSLLTRLPPQSVFVSVTVQGQCVFVVGQQQRQSSLRGPHARYTVEEREEKEGRKERSIPPTTVYVRVCACVCVCRKLFYDPVRSSSHDVAEIFGRDSRTRYLPIPPQYGSSSQGDPPCLSTSKLLLDILPTCVLCLLSHLRDPEPERARSSKLF